jgi:hypothetical protein
MSNHITKVSARPTRKFRIPAEDEDITVSLLEITPADAEKMLLLNTDNRKLRKAKIDEYRRAMNRGDFLFNGDAIRISKDGVLLDGQHRLEALKGADPGVTILQLVVDGLPAISRETIDVGATRTAANLLEFGADRIKNSINVAALGRAAMTMEDPKLSMPSKQEVVHYVHAHQDELETAYLHGHRTIENSPLKGGTTPYALAAYLIGKAEKDDDIIRFFFRKLATGEGLYAGDPILALRNRLVSTPPTTEGGSRSRYMRNSVIFLRAWNAFATGQRLTSIKGWSDGQRFPDAKPVAEKVRTKLGRMMLAESNPGAPEVMFLEPPERVSGEVDNSSVVA